MQASARDGLYRSDLLTHWRILSLFAMRGSAPIYSKPLLSPWKNHSVVAFGNAIRKGSSLYGITQTRTVTLVSSPVFLSVR